MEEKNHHRKKRAQKAHKSKSKVYRTVKKREEIKLLQRKLKNIKRAIQNNIKTKTTNSPSPKKQVLKVVGRERFPSQVKKQLC